jgi:hypothetical protein
MINTLLVIRNDATFPSLTILDSGYAKRLQRKENLLSYATKGAKKIIHLNPEAKCDIRHRWAYASRPGAKD